MSIPFLLNDSVVFDAPLWLCNSSRLWKFIDPDQLPLQVDCSLPLFQELIRVLESGNASDCSLELSQLARRYEIELPAGLVQPEPEPPAWDGLVQPSESETNPDQLLESLFMADDVLLQVYRDEPALSAGVEALLTANRIQAHLNDDRFLLELNQLAKPVHPLLARRLAIIAETVYDEWHADHCNSALLARKNDFFRVLGRL